MAFGQQLSAVRRQTGLTQEQFAEELCVSRQAVSKWESGRGYPEMEKILYICNRYHVTLDQLFAEEVALPAPAAVQPEEETPTLPQPTLQRAFTAFLTNLAAVIGLFLKGGNSDMATTIWIAAIIVFGVVEAATAGLTSIWFVLGSVAALIAAVCGGPLWLQLVLFFTVSVAALAVTRPLVTKLMKKDIKPTNADRVLGGVARVTERIDNDVPTGAVYIDGKTWTARSADGSAIEKDEMVRILRMEGVKLYVEKES